MYVQSDALLFANVFENFIEICELDPAHSLSPPGLAWQACFKKTGTKLELLTDIVNGRTRNYRRNMSCNT